MAAMQFDQAIEPGGRVHVHPLQGYSIAHFLTLDVVLSLIYLRQEQLEIGVNTCFSSLRCLSFL